MAKYDIQDPNSGKTITIEGDSPPTEQELNQMFDTPGEKTVSPVFQASAEINVPMDIANGLTSGLTRLPRAINKIASPVVNPIANALTYLPTEGIRRLKGKPFESFNDYSNRQNNAYNKTLEDYKPQTWQGKVADFTGSIAPTLAVKAETALPNTLLGGGIGFTDSINRGDNPFDVAKNTAIGAGAGLVGYGTLKGAGSAFKKIAPIMGHFAGIPSSAYNRALKAASRGESIFNINKNQADELVNSALQSMAEKPHLQVDEINSIKQSILDKYRNGGTINPTADAVHPQLNQVDKYISESTNYNLPEQYQGFTPKEIEELGFTNEQLGINPEDATMNPIDLHNIKSDIQNSVQHNKESKQFNKQGAGLLRELQNGFGNKLKNTYPEYAPAMDKYADYMASQEFRPWLKYESPYAIARLAAGGSAILGGSIAAHNPFFMAAELGASPRINQFMLQGYGAGSKYISPYLPRAIVTGNNQK